MATLPLKTRLSPEERAARRRLIVQDATALLGLTLAAVLLSTLTYFLYRSFEDHRRELAQRWGRRGEQALASGHPEVAVNALRSALAYEPNRATEVELAEALAQSGRTQEAVAYFNTLRESEPGSGIINLQLARLAARQNEKTLAINYYQTALDGTWHGDGYQRRRDVRLEMARYLIHIQDLGHARDQLLIAAGNAPDQPAVKLEIAGLLEQCQYPADALEIYRALAARRNPPWQALAGVGRTAFALGRYALAKDYLERATDEKAYTEQDAATKATLQYQLTTSRAVLAVYPAADLKLRDRATRVLHDVAVAQARFQSCAARAAPASTPALAGSPTADSSRLNLADALRKLVPSSITPKAAPPASPPGATPQEAAGASPANPPSPTPPGPQMQPDEDLASRWAQVPSKLTILGLEQDPELAQTLMQLVFDTEKDTAQRCGAPQGDDALLLRIAQAPYVVEQR